LREDPAAFAMLAITIIVALTLHEFAHAYVADLQGDRLPRAMGRVSLNPARHLDPFGTILIFLVGFGWGKPVEFRPQAFASKRFGSALVALAGPLMNLLLAILAALVFTPIFNSTGCGTLTTFLLTFMGINVILAVFNLVPLPPLDGSRLLTVFLPPDKQHIIYFLDKYGLLILIVLVLFGGFALLDPIFEFMFSLILPESAGFCGL
jgi:Zn-dependent protease